MKEKPADIPHLPGCYLFIGEEDEVLYVGKAGDLAKRTAQYFHSKRTLRQQILVEKSERLEFIAVQNEVEALLLENNLIKNHQPRYNINLKDAKSYAYLELTAESFPRLVVSRKTKATAEGERFGPFVSAQERDRIRTVLNRLFRLRTCRKFPKRPCIRYHIGACSAPCISAVSEAQYLEQIEDARLVLKGEIKAVRERLEQRMSQASAEQRYEEALIFRKRIAALENLLTGQTVERDRRIDEDAIGYLMHNHRFHVLIFHLSRGRVTSNERFSFDSGADSWEEFLVQYYGAHTCPPELILPEPVDDPLVDYLSTVAGRKVRVTVPQRGRKHHILMMIAQNLELAVRRQHKQLEDLQHHLGLAVLPRVIEGFDISHLAGGFTVASMVQFSAGQPNKSAYRRFRIRMKTGGNDLMAMEEVVRRRYSRLQREEQPLPDLILIDGGPTQLGSAVAHLEALNLSIPICSLAKREEQVFLPRQKNPLPIPRTASGLKLLQQVRDEAHRFARDYNRLLRKKNILDSF